MASQLFSNLALTTLSADITTTVATSATVVDGSILESPTSGDYELLILVPPSLINALTLSIGDVEIIKVTTRSTNTLTIVRGQEGSTAKTWSSGTYVAGRVTAGTLDNFTQKQGAYPFILQTPDFDWTTSGDDVATMVIPTGQHFYPNADEIIFMPTVSDTVTGDPDIKAGTTSAGAELLVAQTITDTDAYDLTVGNLLVQPNMSGTAVYISITVAATATDLQGRVYIPGFMIVD